MYGTGLARKQLEQKEVDWKGKLGVLGWARSCQEARGAAVLDALGVDPYGMAWHSKAS